MYSDTTNNSIEQHKTLFSLPEPVMASVADAVFLDEVGRPTASGIAKSKPVVSITAVQLSHEERLDSLVCYKHGFLFLRIGGLLGSLLLFVLVLQCVAIPLCQFLDRFGKGEVKHLHEELDSVTPFLARPEAMPRIPCGIDYKRRGALVVEGTARLPVAAFPLQVDITAHHVDNIDTVEQVLYGTLLNHRRSSHTPATFVCRYSTNRRGARRQSGKWVHCLSYRPAQYLSHGLGHSCLVHSTRHTIGFFRLCSQHLPIPLCGDGRQTNCSYHYCWVSFQITVDNLEDGFALQFGEVAVVEFIVERTIRPATGIADLDSEF